MCYYCIVDICVVEFSKQVVGFAGKYAKYIKLLTIQYISKTGGEFEIPVKRRIPKILFLGAAALALGALIGAVVTRRIMESD